MGCHFLLQGIFPTQGSNPGLHCRLILLSESPGLSTLEGIYNPPEDPPPLQPLSEQWVELGFRLRPSPVDHASVHLWDTDTLASPTDLFQMQIPRPHHRVSDALRGVAQNLPLTKPPGDSDGGL